MKLYSGYVEIVHGKTVYLPAPMTWLELQSRRFGPLLLPAAIATMATGQVMGAMSAKRQGENEAAIAKYNAAVSEQEAKQVEMRSRFESVRQAEDAERVGSELLVNVSASGSTPTQGAGLLARATQSVQSELDNLLIGYEGRIGASRARSQAAGYRMEATAAKQRGQAGFTSGIIGAAGTTLLGAYAMRKPPGGDYTKAGRAVITRY
jgi:hypothetical protein